MAAGLAVLALCAVRGQAQAALVTNLTIANEASLASLNGSVYATVTVSAASSTVVNFTVDPNEAVLTPGSNFGLQSFGFNYNAAATGNIAVTGLPAGWSVSLNMNQDGFGQFEIVSSGTGGTRQDPLTFSVTVANALSASDLENAFFEANSEGHHYAGHIAGFEIDGVTVTSSFFTDGDGSVTEVPEPGSLLLLGLGAGLTGMGIVRRRQGRRPQS